jgi:hypothetical protein
MTLNKCRSLDEYNHEFIEDNDLRFRNGDQVVSYFIERIRRDTSQAEQPSAQAQLVHPRQNIASDGLRRRIISRSLGYLKPKSSNRTVFFGPSESAGNLVERKAEAEWEKSRTVTPSQLESQNDTSRAMAYRAFLAHWQPLLALMNGTPASTGDISGADEKDNSHVKNNITSPDPNDDQVKEQEPQECLLQQILTVPQLWLWAVDGRHNPLTYQTMQT